MKEINDIFKSLSDEELKNIPSLSKEEIEEALRRGKRDADLYLKNCGLHGLSEDYYR